MFALINLNIQRKFTGGHALALYENCFRFVAVGSTGWLDLGLFRRLMGVEDSAYYQTFKHLNAKIIKPAVAEVNKVSDILVTPETRKQGRAEQLRRVQTLVAARSPTRRDADRRMLGSTLNDGAARADFERHGWMSALNTQAIFAFWQELEPGAFEDVS